MTLEGDFLFAEHCTGWEKVKRKTFADCHSAASLQIIQFLKDNPEVILRVEVLELEALLQCLGADINFVDVLLHLQFDYCKRSRLKTKRSHLSSRILA